MFSVRKLFIGGTGRVLFVSQRDIFSCGQYSVVGGSRRLRDSRIQENHSADFAGEALHLEAWRRFRDRFLFPDGPAGHVPACFFPDPDPVHPPAFQNRIQRLSVRLHDRHRVPADRGDLCPRSGFRSGVPPVLPDPLLGLDLIQPDGGARRRQRQPGGL